MELKFSEKEVFNKKISFAYFLLFLVVTSLYILIINHVFYGLALGLISLSLAIISWNMSNKIESDNYIVFVVVIFLNVLAFIPFLIYYYYKRFQRFKEFELQKK